MGEPLARPVVNQRLPAPARHAPGEGLPELRAGRSVRNLAAARGDTVTAWNSISVPIHRSYLANWQWPILLFVAADDDPVGLVSSGLNFANNLLQESEALMHKSLIAVLPLALIAGSQAVAQTPPTATEDPH